MDKKNGGCSGCSSCGAKSQCGSTVEKKKQPVLSDAAKEKEFLRVMNAAPKFMRADIIKMRGMINDFDLEREIKLRLKLEQDQTDIMQKYIDSFEQGFALDEFDAEYGKADEEAEKIQEQIENSHELQHFVIEVNELKEKLDNERFEFQILLQRVKRAADGKFELTPPIEGLDINKMMSGDGCPIYKSSDDTSKK